MRAVATDLENNNWLDVNTAAVFAEIVLGLGSSDLCVSTVAMLEITPSGTWTAQKSKAKVGTFPN